MSAVAAVGKYAYCPSHVNFFKNKGRYFARGAKTPQAGDIIFFTTSGTSACHVGIVVSVGSGKVNTVEGNTSGASTLVSNGGGVFQKSYYLTSTYILGYGRPSYAPGEAAKMVSIALGEVGYLEKRSSSNLDSKTANAGSNNYTKYGKWYGLDGQAWCDMFVSWCAYMVDQGGSATVVTPAPTNNATTYTNVSGKVKLFGPAKKWQNGSTSEIVYMDSKKATKIGELDPYDSALCIGKYQSMYIIVYNVSGSSVCKIGFVEYAGGCSSNSPTTKNWRNGSTDELVYFSTQFSTSAKVGSLNPRETCVCFGTVDGKYAVAYKVDGKAYYKVGLVKYAGGLS